ncbi:DNA translocase FtsK, partial [Nautilia sp.]
MRKSVFVFIIALILYLFISTLVPQPGVVGKIGEFLGKSSFELFGYLSYIFPFLLGVLAYFWYGGKYDYGVCVKVLGGVFLFFDSLFFQSALFKKGIIGNLFVGTLEKYIGVVGVGLLIFVLFLWGVFLLFEERIIGIFHRGKKDVANVKKSAVKNEPPAVVDDGFEIPVEKPDDLDVEDVILDESDKIPAYESGDTFGETGETEEISFGNKAEEEEMHKVETEKETPVLHVHELEDTKKLLSQIETGERKKPKDWKFPPLKFLKAPKKGKKEINESEIDKKIKTLIEKLRQFKIEGDVVRYYVGPVVTTFEFKPLPHIKVSK